MPVSPYIFFLIAVCPLLLLFLMMTSQYTRHIFLFSHIPQFGKVVGKYDKALDH